MEPNQLCQNSQRLFLEERKGSSLWFNLYTILSLKQEGDISLEEERNTRLV
jgi:hypothetical protein